MVDREENYVFGPNPHLLHNIQFVYNNYLFNFRNTGLYIHSQMLVCADKFKEGNFQLNAIFFTINFFLFMIDGILIYSVTLSDVEERTYEFAMLRTLGLKNKSLAILLVIQILI